MAGSLAFVTGLNSNSLAVVDVTDPTSPTIVGSVASATAMGWVREKAVGGCGGVCGGGAVAHASSLVLPRELLAPTRARTPKHRFVLAC